MRNRTITLLLTAILFLLPCFAQKRENLTAQVVRSAHDYTQLAAVLPIIRKDNAVYRYIPSVCPLREKFRISSNYGQRFHPILKRPQFHGGVDMAAQYAATVHATADGVVTYAGYCGSYGNMVEVTHQFGFVTRYGHMTYVYAKRGQVVKKGDVIGFVGSTGRSTGNHLHYEVIKNKIKINPKPFF